jgi:methylmalonyl-CoA mutase N-terminal domain/subunit
MQDQIGDSAYRAQQAIERGEAIVVGVNAYTDAADEVAIPIQRIDPAIERDQVERTRTFRRSRDPAQAAAALEAVQRAAAGTANVMPVFIDAVDAGVTLGEICGVLRDAFGRYVAHERIA